MRQIILFLFLITPPLSAAIFHPMDTTRPLHCQISRQHHNRILIEGSRIKKVIFPEDRLFVKMEESSGQVFIQPRYPLQEKTVLSIISDSGLVQDLEVDFVDDTSQIIVLVEKTRHQSSSLQELCLNKEPDDRTSIIHEIRQGRAPSGYVLAPVTNAYKTLKSKMKTRLIGRFLGNTQELLVYQIHNPTLWKKKINEKELIAGRALWFHFSKTEIKSRESGLAIVAIPS